MIARAYVYSGRWVADCPRGCNNTELLFEKRPAQPEVEKHEYHCSYCGYETRLIDWPANRVEIETVLNLRPIPHNRNWYPSGHDIAVRFRVPHGQTVDQLREENAEHDVPTS